MSAMPKIVVRMRRQKTRVGRSRYPQLRSAVATRLYAMWQTDKVPAAAAEALGLDLRVVQAWFAGFKMKGNS